MSAVIEAKNAEISKNGTSEEDRFNIYRLRVDDYEKMIEYGIFNDEYKIKLWEGVLVEMSPKGVSHSAAKTLANNFFYRNLSDRAIIRGQDPIRLDDFSEPEPDIVLASLPLSKYFLSHPTPQDILLILEIADSIVAKDRAKARGYARNGIIQYLLLNLNTREIEDYREPGEDGYRQKRTYKADESFSLAAFPDIVIAVGEFLPSEQTN